MEGTFGSRLRSERERQQIALTVIAEQTKIKASLLEGLERDDVSQWPMGIFRRSFVRAYAHAIGLDPDAVLREFLELYPDPVEEDIPAILAAARESRRPPTRLGCLISSAISALPAVRSGARTRLVRGLTPADDDCPAAASEASAEAAHLMESERPEPRSEPMPLIADATDGADVDSGGGRLAEQPAEQTPGDGFDRPAPVSGPSFASRPDRAPAAGECETSAIAALCTRLAVALHPRDVAPVLEHAARVLHAVGLTLWMWDPATHSLRHVLAHGYTGDVAASLPRVRYDADNAIADAFRSADTRVVPGGGLATGALVVPIVAPGGCTGVLALEFRDRSEERESVRALATILAAQLATLFGYAPLTEAVSA